MSARAEAWPTKPLRMVVPYPAGGPTDVLARSLAAKMGEGLGQQIVVDNKPGGAGNIGSEIGAKAAPDGYTLTMGNNATHATNQTLIPATPFDASKDFAAIGLTTMVTHVLVVHPDVPAKTIQEFVSWAKAEGDKLSYASTGNGSASNLAMELFKGATGLQAVHVPYRGSAPAVQDLIGGVVKCSFQTLPSVLSQIRSNKLRALAVSSLKRNANLPDVPTVDETVVKGFQADAWFGLFAPAHTPSDIITRLNTEMVKALTEPATAEVIAKAGFDITPSNPKELADFVTVEIVKWAKVVKDSGAKAE
ncbi:MAG: Bug family tripartite tricarboxylate transporter substrate binding protein [Reyranellales bacterium]